MKKENYERLEKLVETFKEDSEKAFSLFEKYFGSSSVVKGYVLLDNNDNTKLHIRLKHETEGDDENGVLSETNILVATTRHYDEDGYNPDSNIRHYDLEKKLR